MRTAAMKLAKWISEREDLNVQDLLDLAGEMRSHMHGHGHKACGSLLEGKGAKLIQKMTNMQN